MYAVWLSEKVSKKKEVPQQNLRPSNIHWVAL